MKKIIPIFILSLLTVLVFGQTETEKTSFKAEKVVKASYFDKTLPLRDIQPVTPGERRRTWPNDRVDNPSMEEQIENLDVPENLNAIDPVVQTNGNRESNYWPLRSVMGMGNVNGVYPPDTDGAVGPDHYFLMVNLSFAIYNKEGLLLYGPADNSTLWDGFPGPWSGTNDGDPIVLYDQEADRWFASQFAVNTNNNTFWELVAISETGDPLGAWYRYAFQFNYFNDYPKFGVWHNAYLGTFNFFNASATSYVGGGAVALEREAMLAGDPDAQMIMFPVSSSKFGIMPADFDGTPPPATEPAWFAHINRTGNKNMEIWKAELDWDSPASSTYTLANSLAVAAFNASVGSIPQPSTTQTLDAIGGQLMFRLQYRNFGSYSTLVANHTVTANARAAIRWYELRKTGTDWSIYQQATYQPDDDFRWMGSIAMNANGNIALGYGVSSSTTFPSIRYAGRTADAPLGEFNIPESVIVNGAAAQTNVSRWGDYSAMTIDPADDSTFWYAHMYRLSNNWRTHFASFNFAPGVGPEINAGEDQIMCVNQNTVTTTATGVAVQSVLWTTEGDGLLLYNNRMETLYAPGTNDRASGSVMLKITAEGYEGTIVSDSFNIIIVGLPEAMAGNDTIVCATESIEMVGQAMHADSTFWSTTGDGSFDNANLLNAVYTPGPQDILDGEVELTLEAYANTVCTDDDTDQLVLMIDDCTSTEELAALASMVSVNPNPTTGRFTLKVDNERKAVINWQLLDASGKKVMQANRSSKARNYSESFDLEQYPNGTYVLQILIGQQRITEKIILNN